MDKLFFLVVIAVFVLGPERIPHYAHQLSQLVKRLKLLVGEAKVRAAEEFGPEFDVDWKKLDPRQYDPRRIVREALLDDEPMTGFAPDVVDAVEQPARFTGVSLGGTARRPGETSGKR